MIKFRLFKKRCEHTNVRCIHGDEVVTTCRGWLRPSFARARCLDCGIALYNHGLPPVCSDTGRPHFTEKRKVK